MVEIAKGHDGNPYGLLGAVGGLSYIAAVLILRRRSENQRALCFGVRSSGSSTRTSPKRSM